MAKGLDVVYWQIFLFHMRSLKMPPSQWLRKKKLKKNVTSLLHLFQPKDYVKKKDHPNLGTGISWGMGFHFGSVLACWMLHFLRGVIIWTSHWRHATSILRQNRMQDIDFARARSRLRAYPTMGSVGDTSLLHENNMMERRQYRPIAR